MNFTIDSFSPVKLLLASWLVWLFSYLIAPFSYKDVEYSGVAIAVLLGLLLSFIVGFYFKDILPIKIKTPKVGKEPGFYRMRYVSRKAVICLFFFGVIGVALKLYEHILVNQIFTFSSFFDYKLSRMYNDFNSGMLGVISAILYPFGLVALIIQITFQIFKKPIQILLLWFCGLYWIVDSLLLSSMTSAVIVIGMVFISRVIAGSLQSNKTHLPYWLVFPISVVIVGYFSYLTFFRVTVDFIGVSLESRAMEIDFEINSVLVFSIVNFAHYLIHGVIEWFRLFDHVGLEIHYWGAYEFYPLIKIFTAMGLDVPTFSALAEVAHKTGVYTTFWGPFILDFGVFSFMAAFIAGLLSATCYSSAKKGSYFGLLIYPIVALQLIVSPIINIFSGVVVYYLVAALVSIPILKLVKK